MRRLARWVLNAVTVLSLLLCVASTVMWVQSYQVSGRLCYEFHNQRRYVLGSERGEIWLELIQEPKFVAALRGSRPDEFWSRAERYEPWWSPWESRYSPRDFLLRRWGIYAVHGDRECDLPPLGRSFAGDVGVSPASALAIPYWLATLFALGLPFVAVARSWRASHRTSNGVCLQCSYDLTGNLSGVCPECGMAIVEVA